MGAVVAAAMSYLSGRSRSRCGLVNAWEGELVLVLRPASGFGPWGTIPAGAGQCGPSLGDAGTAHVDRVLIELPVWFALDELQLCGCHVHSMTMGCDSEAV